MRFILGVVLFFFTLSIFLQIAFFEGINKDFFAGLIPNILTEIIGIAITLFVIDKLLEKYKRKEDIKVIKDIIGNQFEMFVLNISNAFINFVTKKPFSYNGKESQISQLKIRIREIKDNITLYVKSDFIRRPVRILMLNPKDVFNSQEQEIPYQMFCERHFKQTINSQIDEFLNRYISILPSDIRNSIFKISDLLKSNVLLTPLQHGLLVNLDIANINEDDFRLIITQVCQEIENLLEYC